ncbi:MAG: ATP synthase subunit I [Solirubrobacterales bacterium]
MNDDVKGMLKKILVLDLIVGAFLSVIVCVFFSKYLVVFMLGIIVSLASFAINSFMTQYAYNGYKKNPALITLVGFFIRVLLVCAIGFFIYQRNTINVLAYMLGYSSHFISLTLYGILINKEGK